MPILTVINDTYPLTPYHILLLLLLLLLFIIVIVQVSNLK